MTEPTITCPNCKTDIKPTESTLNVGFRPEAVSHKSLTVEPKHTVPSSTVRISCLCHSDRMSALPHEQPFRIP